MRQNKLDPRYLRQFYEAEAAIIGPKKPAMYAQDMCLQKRLWDERIRMLQKYVASCGSFLDIGSAEGYFVEAIRNLFGLNVYYVGLDISMNYLQFGEKSKKENYVQGDAQLLPFKESSFDVVMISEVLEHLPDPLAAVSEGLRVTSSFLLITTPRRSVFRWALDGMGFLRDQLDLGLGHINEIGIDQIKNWSAKKRGKIVSVKLDCYVPNGVINFLHMPNWTVTMVNKIAAKLPFINTKFPMLQIFLLSK